MRRHRAPDVFISDKNLVEFREMLPADLRKGEIEELDSPLDYERLLLEESMDIFLDFLVFLIVQIRVVLTIFYDVVDGMSWRKLESFT
jgi:hypothetical protein